MVWLITRGGGGGGGVGGLFKQQFVVYAISRQGIEQIGSSFGFIFPSFSMKVPWEGAGGIMLRVAHGKCSAPGT